MSAPSPTLFVQNINDKVKKQELRRTLYALFGSYGKVIDVVHTRDVKVRGTAFVVFRDLAASTSALRALDGEAFYGKQLRISYAKSKSHATIGLEEGPEAVYAIKAGLQSALEKTSRLTVSGAQRKQMEDSKKAKRGREEEEEEEEDSDEDAPEKKKGKGADASDDDAMEEESDDDAPAPLGAPSAAPGSESNPVLFIDGLPADATSDILRTLFQQYPGLSNLQLLPTPAGSPPNSGTGFVHYETTVQAGVAMEALDSFLLAKGAPLKVSWAKRG
ncbi:RNA-binding domain-containing protein [Meredithblackwellia eburnea MCA 4105]